MFRSSRLSFLLLALPYALGRIVPGQYIVELENVSSLGAKRSYGSPHDALYSDLQKRGIAYNVQAQYDTQGIFVGASLSVSPEEISSVASLSGVKAIHPVHSVSQPKRINARVAKAGDATLPDAESTHIMTGVDKVHAQGITGKGIKIGIIDTGIDYNHPYLGAGFGSGFKVIGGYDFVGDAYTGSNTPVPDSDPLDQCNGHGTHVAGIIGANPGNDFGISGVAYEASISSYRVFGCTGSTQDDVIIDALLKGYNEGMHILTLSLGGVDGWIEGAAGVVASRIVDKGKVVTIAAGNEGAYGAWYASSPGTGLDVISVASVDNTVIPAQNATVHGVSHDPISYLSAIALPANNTLAVYATSKDATVTDDACSALPDSTPDLSDKVVIVRRGTCSFVTKLANIAAKGGKIMLIYNNVAGFSSISVGDYHAALISAEDGAWLVSEFASGASVSLSFPQSGGAANIPSATAGLVSDFSTYGPTYDMNFKPAVAAPGGNILSTLPLALGAWGVESGTSMATPFTAGSAALVLQAKGTGADIAKGLRSLFQATAAPVSATTSDGDLQTLAVQGAGLIQVNAAIGTKTIVSPTQLLLNDTAHLNPIQTFKIKNTGSSTVSYKLTHVPAGTIATFDTTTGFPVDGPIGVTSSHATVLLSQSQVTLRAGASATIIVTVIPPSLSSSTLPVYSGYIRIASSAETQQVSYLGAVGNLKDRTVFDTTNKFFGFSLPAVLNSTGDVQQNVTTYSLSGDDQPSVLFRQFFGTPLFRADLVSKDFKIPTLSHHKRDLLSWLFGTNANSIAGVKTLGVLAEYDYIPRNSDASDAADNGYSTIVVDGTFADGSKIKDGSYKILLSALRVSGNPNLITDYEMSLTSEFIVKH